MSLEDFLDLLENVKPYSNGYTARCPAHDDNASSLGITEGDDGRILLTCYAGCTETSAAPVVAAMGLTEGDLFPGGRRKQTEPLIVYPYTDEQGNVLFEACRFEGKKFRQRRLNEEGEYVYNLEGVRRVLFNLPNVIAAVSVGSPIYITEGEKDALSFAEHGLVATCNPMGAGKWNKDFNNSLVGANVTIIQDRDEPGRHHAERVRQSLQDDGISVAVMEAKEGKDATDHFEADYGVSDFVPVIQRVRRGIVTAREMADTGKLHLKSEEGSVPEYVIPDFPLGKYSLSFRQGRPYLLGGYTGDGKTTWALQTARTLCSQVVPPRVGFFSMEMAADDLRNRLLQHWGIPLWEIEHPWAMTIQQKRIFRAALEQLKEWPLEVIFDTQLSAQSICDTTRDRDYDIIFIDHIHRFSWGGERRNLESEIAMLTNLALDYNIPVVTLAQFRAVRSGQGKFEKFPRPTLAEFKETSVLGEESALALAIWRLRANDGTTYEEGGLTEFIALKNRYGAVGSSYVRLDSRRMLFTPTAPEVTQHGNDQGTKEPSDSESAY